VELESAALTANWDQVARLPLLPVNQAIAQLGIPLSVAAGVAPDGIHLVFGHASPPLLIGDHDAKLRQLEELGHTLEVTPGARFLVSRQFVEQLIDVLGQTLEQYDQAVAAGKKEEAETSQHG
jgi:hypothetical protein